MAKTGIGSAIFCLLFGVIFGFSAYLFFSVVSGLDIAEMGIFAGVGAALGGLLIIFSGGIAIISGVLMIVLFIATIDRIKTYRRQKKFQNQ